MQLQAFAIKDPNNEQFIKFPGNSTVLHQGRYFFTSR
jgi:hypothetical protein